MRPSKHGKAQMFRNHMDLFDVITMIDVITTHEAGTTRLLYVIHGIYM